MFIDKNGSFYVGDMRVGDREATPDELAAHELTRQPPAPTKVQRIAALLSAAGETRLTVQICIEVSEDKARALAPTYAMTPEQAIAFAYQKNKAYKTCKDLETEIRRIESLP